jgi:hypothetical protein
MPAKRRTPKARSGAIPDLEWSILNDQTDPFDVPGWDGYFFRYHQLPGSLLTPTLGDFWLTHGEEITADWAVTRPGTRPSFWWKFSAPRWATWDAALGEPRAQVGGAGEAVHRRSCALRLNLLHYAIGVSQEWRGTDPADPPMVESQAAYLRRHGLFLPGEARRLSAADYVPELVRIAGGD